MDSGLTCRQSSSELDGRTWSNWVQKLNFVTFRRSIGALVEFRSDIRDSWRCLNPRTLPTLRSLNASMAQWLNGSMAQFLRVAEQSRCLRVELWLVRRTAKDYQDGWIGAQMSQRNSIKSVELASCGASDVQPVNPTDRLSRLSTPADRKGKR